MGKLELKNSDALVQDLKRLTGLFESDSVTNLAILNAAEIIAERAVANARIVITPRSRNLINSIKVGPLKNNGKYRSVTIGVHRKDIDLSKKDGEYYPAYVEFGHGGPRPAGEHPFMRPAFDAKQDEAYSLIRQSLIQAIDKIGE